jgi:putative membrane protein
MRLTRQRPFLVGLIGWLLTVWVWAAIAPLDRRDWLLENLLVFVYAAVLFTTYRRFAFSNLSYGLFAAFITLHLVGSHYTYSEVPLGAWLKDWLGLARNHFDRLVHFSYGFLLVYAFREVLLREVAVPRGWANFLAVTLVLAFSAFFEVIEALVAIIVSPELGDAYLGTQGDIWDAQKDMGLAVVGALLGVGVILRRELRAGFTSSRD